MKGTITVEIAYIMPVLFLMIVMTILTTFYFHDMCILHGVSYEAGIIGSRHIEDPEGLELSELAGMIGGNHQNKLILFPDVNVTMEESGDVLEVEVWAEKSMFSVATNRRVPLVHQEKKVRDFLKLQSMIEE